MPILLKSHKVFDLLVKHYNRTKLNKVKFIRIIESYLTYDNLYLLV